jgi:hypothetical protein
MVIYYADNVKAGLPLRQRLFHRLVCNGDIDLATALDRDLLLSELEEFGISSPPDRTDGHTLLAIMQAAREDLARLPRG